MITNICAKVSIILPVYNSEKYIQKCLESIISQSYKNIEILIVDDGSTDNTNALISEYVNKDNRIVYIRKENEGVSIARNVALLKSSGKYICFVDSDDFLEKKAIEILVSYMSNCNVDLVIGSYNILRRKCIYSTNIFNNYIYSREEIISEINKKNFLLATPWAKLYKSEIIKKNNLFFDANLSYGEDTCFNFDYVKFCSLVKVIDKIVYNYLLGGEASMIKYHDNINESCAKLFKKKLNIVNDIDIQTDIYKHYLCIALNHYMIHCSKKNAIKKMNTSVEMFREVKKTNELQNRIENIVKSENFIEKYYRKFFFNAIKNKIKIIIKRYIRY